MQYKSVMHKCNEHIVMQRLSKIILVFDILSTDTLMKSKSSV